MNNDHIKLEPSWKQELLEEFDKEYMKNLKLFLQEEVKSGQTIYPQSGHIFEAFNTTGFNDVKVVLLGQDPYHGPNQAHGLCFSVRPEVKPPPSLVNIYKELKEDLGIDQPNHGYLKDWADQGVLLLNAVLTVRSGSPASHQNKGWELFTDRAIKQLSDKRERLVFLLWGSYAQKKGVAIDRSKHLVLEAAHPSPFSVYRGFYGCKHFSKTNAYLLANGKNPINWQLAPLSMGVDASTLQKKWTQVDPSVSF